MGLEGEVVFSVLTRPSLSSPSLSVDRLLSPAYRQLTPLEEQLKELLEKLDLSTAMKHSPSRSKRLKLLKKTIMEVRSELSLKMLLPSPSPPPPPVAEADDPIPTESEDQALPEPPSPPSTSEDKSLPPPTLEPLTPQLQLDGSPVDSDPPPLKPVKPGVDPSAMELDDDVDTTTSVPRQTVNGHAPDPPLPNGDLHPEASAVCSRQKSTSPQKANTPETLGAKTFLSVVIPRLETLLLPKKRTRSSSVDDEETPIKRLGTGRERLS